MEKILKEYLDGLDKKFIIILKTSDTLNLCKYQYNININSHHYSEFTQIKYFYLEF